MAFTFFIKNFMFKLLIMILLDFQIESHSQNIRWHHNLITDIDIRMTVKSGFSCIKINVLHTIYDFPTTRLENCFSKSIHTLLLMYACGDRGSEKSTASIFIYSTPVVVFQRKNMCDRCIYAKTVQKLSFYLSLIIFLD